MYKTLSQSIMQNHYIIRLQIYIYFKVKQHQMRKKYQETVLLDSKCYLKTNCMLYEVLPAYFLYTKICFQNLNWWHFSHMTSTLLLRMAPHTGREKKTQGLANMLSSFYIISSRVIWNMWSCQDWSNGHILILIVQNDRHNRHFNTI